MDTEQFRDPGQEYREIPFWSWNDLLDPDELRWQIRQIKEGGWGGFFMHSRAGLRTPYMGPDWLACVRAAVEEARSCGLQAWLYDEDKWPSGYGGGASVAGSPGHRAKHLVCKVDSRPNLLAERVATFRAREAGGVLVDICPDPAPRLIRSDDRLIQFYPAVMALGNEIFNDYAYVDLLNADAVAAFLDSTHSVYAGEIGDEFGRTVPGIFTDEPCLQFHRYSYGEYGYQAEDPAVPWTDDLPEFFRAANGYDLLPHLPSLFFDAGDYHKVRYDFYRCVTVMFLERFTKPVRRWCEERGLQFAGHFMGEDTLLWQIPWVGAVMPHLAFMRHPRHRQAGPERQRLRRGDGADRQAVGQHRVPDGEGAHALRELRLFGPGFQPCGPEMDRRLGIRSRRQPEQSTHGPLQHGRRAEAGLPAQPFLPAALVAGEPARCRLLRAAELRVQPGATTGRHPRDPSRCECLDSLPPRRLERGDPVGSRASTSSFCA